MKKRFFPLSILAITLVVSLLPGLAFASESSTQGVTTSSTKAQAASTTTAKKKAKTYKVVFKANGGKGIMKAQTIKRGKKTALRVNSFKRSGYKFIGWNTKKNGKGKTYKNKAKIKNLAKAGKKVTLYAQWKYNVSYQDIYSGHPVKINNTILKLIYSKLVLIKGSKKQTIAKRVTNAVTNGKYIFYIQSKSQSKDVLYRYSVKTDKRKQLTQGSNLLSICSAADGYVALQDASNTVSGEGGPSTIVLDVKTKRKIIIDKKSQYDQPKIIIKNGYCLIAYIRDIGFSDIDIWKLNGKDAQYTSSISSPYVANGFNDFWINGNRIYFKVFKDWSMKEIRQGYRSLKGGEIVWETEWEKFYY